MVISETHKFIFIHIPKNAGTSMASSLLNITKEKKHWAVSDLTKHQNLRDLIALNQKANILDRMVKNYDFLEYYKFAIVRNPYCRMISLFNYLKKYEIRKEIHSIDNFESFIRLLEDEGSWVSNLHSTKEQLSFLLDNDNKIAVDYIGRYEELDKTIKELNERLKLKIQLERLNYSIKNKIDNNLYYNDLTKQIVFKRFKNDFENFNYSF